MDFEEIGKDMLEAAWNVLKERAPGIRSYTEGEFKKLAQTLATIEVSRAQNQISDEEARILVEMQKGASRAVLLTTAGLEVVVVERAINAALGAVKSAVNTALGFALL